MDAWVTPYLEALRKTGIKAKACRSAGVSYSVVSQREQRDADFAAAVADAMEEAVDRAEAEAWRRGVEGVKEPLTHQGQITYEMEEYADEDDVPRYRPRLDPQGNKIPVTVRKYSDPMLALILKGRRKKVFADRTELTGAEGGPVVMDSSARAARIAQLMAAAQARKEADDLLDGIA